MERIGQGSFTLKRISSMLFFIGLAGLLWLIIKLSSTYTVTEKFTVYMLDIPSDRLILKDTQVAKVAISTTGFKLLNYYFTSELRRKIDVSLNEIPYHKIGNNVYAFNSIYAEEKIAFFLDINKNDVRMNELELSFVMDELSSKKLPVVADIKMSFDKQYGNYGEPTLSPDSIIVFGPAYIVNTLQSISTQNTVLKNINKNISMEVPLNFLDGQLKSDIESVLLNVKVEKYTEAVAEVPISSVNTLKLRLFPEKVSVKYVVALKDYSNISSLSFRAEIDTTQLFKRERLLPVRLTQYPNNTQILSFSPQEVEYIIIQE